MQRQQATVGPLAASSATAIAATSQTVAASGFVVMDGTLGTATANNISLSQTVSGAALVKLNGSTSTLLVQTGAKGAYLGSLQRIYITSAGNDSGITFAVVGLDQNGASVTETITGANAGVVASVYQYWSVISIKTSGSTASTITVGSFGAAKMDTPRQVLITTGTAVAFNITGTDWANSPITETVTNSGASVASVLSYNTVTSIQAVSQASSLTVGTNGVADSPWLRFDEFAPGFMSIQCNVAGTVNYTVFFTNDNPNAFTGTNSPANVVWSSAASPFVGVSTTGQANMTVPFSWGKVTLNSETAGAGNSVTAKFIQYSAVPQ